MVEGFAPTSRAAHQLREAGVTADTFQGFLARARTTNDPSQINVHDECNIQHVLQLWVGGDNDGRTDDPLFS